MFDYDGSVAGSIPLVKDTVYYVTQVNGKWGLVKTMDETKEGWSPIDYLKECSPNETQNLHHLHHLLLQQQQHLQGLTELLIQLVQPPAQTLLPVHTTNATLNGSLGNGLADALKAKSKKKLH